MASIGQELKRERELRSISLKEIADQTKINIRFLRALEEDRLDMMPEKFFTRGIIRSYAKYLGLDEQSTLNTYLESLQVQREGQAEKKEKVEDEESPRKKNPLFIISLIFIFIVASIIILYFIFQKKETPPPKPSQTVQTQVPREATVTAPINQDKPEKKQDELILDITVQHETWMEIYADGELQYSGIKYPGTHLEFKALKEFLLHLGNAGGIIYTVNGEEGKKLGMTGAVIKDILINLDNFHEFFSDRDQTPEEKKQ
jgi:transcriptional regulator with XRE-family HTH domain